MGRGNIHNIIKLINIVKAFFSADLSAADRTFKHELKCQMEPLNCTYLWNCDKYRLENRFNRS